MSYLITAEIDTTKAFRYQWLIWQYFGLQPPKRSSKWFKYYFVYALILNLSVLLFPVSLIIKLISSQDLAELCESLYNTLTDLVANIKFFSIIAVKHKLLEAQSILKTLDARAKTRKEREILREGVAAAEKIFNFLARLTICGIITSQMIVYLSNERALMYTAWYPWDWKASRSNFLWAHLYQSYALILQATQHLANETYPPGYLIILSAHIKTLGCRIKELNSDGTKSEEEVYQELKDCIKDHKTIHKIFLIIQDTISITCLLQFAATGLAQCSIGVYMLYVGVDPSKLINLGIYMSVITMDIFILCYYGDLYCQANDHLADSIYACNWVDRSAKFKKCFLFLLKRSQMPTTIMAGNMIPVRMPTFVTIIKTAYSVFTVLNEAK